MWQAPAYLYTRNGLANSSALMAGSTTLFNNTAGINSESISSITYSGTTATVTMGAERRFLQR